MIKNIYYSAGSESYLNKEIQNHPDRLLRLAESHDMADKYLLFDFSDQNNILGDSIHLDVIHEVGDDNTFKGFFYCQAFDIAEERDDSLIETGTVALDKSIAKKILIYVMASYVAMMITHVLLLC